MSGANNSNWCSNCKVFRDIGEFEVKQSGKRKKLCNRHSTKRKLEKLFDDWQTFETRIKSWSRPGQTQPLEIDCVFNLDDLPISFPAKLPTKEDEKLDRSPLNNAMRQIVELIWESGGFRFRHQWTHWNSELPLFGYVCSQDADRAQASISKGERDAARMERFSCKSKLTLKPCLNDRSLAVSLRHTYHAPYDNHQLSSDVLEFIKEHCAHSTPSEVYRDLQTSQPSGWKTATRQQVYYYWQQLNSQIWRREIDAFASAQCSLSEKNVPSLMYVSGNVRMLAFFIPDSISALASRTKELAMDATYGTNNMGADLFAVMAELDGTGVPLAYCFVDIFKDNKKGKRNAEPGTIVDVLIHFLRALKEYHLNPTFFGIDKDSSEIFAVRSVWPEATIQLCYWHARKAITTKLKSSDQTKTQDGYWPLEAQALIPELEICWGSIATHRPDGDHRYGCCDCPSHKATFSREGRMEPARGEEQDTVLQIFSRHFNAHTFIPDQNGTHKTSEQLHRDSAAEMYIWCRSRNYFRLWAYLWVNWYCPKEWALWARSANAKEIPILKTTMIVESHWRTIKHDYLHRFSRPRVDLVVWVLLSRLIPASVRNMQALIDRDHRTATASWRKDFKREWKTAMDRLDGLIPSSIQRYHTDARNFTCSCPSFLESRFAICKHILFCYEPVAIPKRREFFQNVERRRTLPLWAHHLLVLQPEYHRPNLAAVDEVLGSSDAQDDEEDSDQAATNEDEGIEEDSEEDVDSSDHAEDAMDRFEQDVQSAMVFFREQRAKGNKKFAEAFMSSVGPSIGTFVKEVTAYKNQHTMSRTWDRRWKHRATKYYKHYDDMSRTTTDD